MVSDSKPNAKIKRWKGRIEETVAKVAYKPGKENLVAMSRHRRTGRRIICGDHSQ